MRGTSAPSAPAGGGRDAATVTKAYFQVVGDLGQAIEGAGTVPKQLECTFNPSTLKISGGAKWGEGEDQANRRGLPQSQFNRPEPRTLSVELFLDDWGSDRGDITGDVDILFAWMRPRRHSEEEVRPPFVQFRWGSQNYFHAYISSVDVTYELFRQDGTPVRGTASITLNEAVDPSLPEAQNPTSGGPGGHRARVVGAGDTLQSIAAEEYGEPSLWRGLAAANGIDDPMRLATGDRVLIPEADDAAERS